MLIALVFICLFLNEAIMSFFVPLSLAQVNVSFHMSNSLHITKQLGCMLKIQTSAW